MTPTDILLALMAVGGGAMLPIQFAVNSHLGRLLGSPIAASIVSFGAGLVFLLLLSAIFVRNLPSAASLKGMPSHVFYIGGACGAFFVAVAIVVTPRLGTAAMAVFAILGQLLAATAIDHFGLLGVAVRETTPGRLVGALLVIAGAVMVRSL